MMKKMRMGIVKEMAMMTMAIVIVTVTMEIRLVAMTKITAKGNSAVCLKMRKHSRE